MNSCPKSVAAKRVVFAAAGAILAVSTTGCNSLDARRNAQDGNRLFAAGKFVEAAEAYETSLKKEDLPVTHHNLALTYAKLVQPGCKPDKDVDTYGRPRCPDNTKYADRATEEFAIFLKTDPKNEQVRELMSQIWMQNKQFDKALAFWTKEYEADPKNGDIMGKLGVINFRAKNWRVAMDWYEKQAGVSETPVSKAASFQSIGNIAYSVLGDKQGTQWDDRIECADRGIGALEKASQLQPKRPELPGLAASLWSMRSVAQGPTWAAAIDRASTQIFLRTRDVINQEAKKAAGQNNATGTPPTTPGGSGSGSNTSGG